MDVRDLSTEKREALTGIKEEEEAMLIQVHRIKKGTAKRPPTMPKKFDKYTSFITKRMGRELSTVELDLRCHLRGSAQIPGRAEEKDPRPEGTMKQSI